MHMDITFIHTAEVHVETFSALVNQYNAGKDNASITVKHVVNSELLERAVANGISTALTNEVEQLVLSHAKQSKLVVCSCSTLGSIVEAVTLNDGNKAIRIDRAMADVAVQAGQKILVLAALESTLLPTQQLMQSSQLKMATSNSIDYLVVTDSWSYFLAGKQQEYLQTIAEVIEDKQGSYDCIVLAQASMAGAIKHVKQAGPPILSSPEIGVESLMQSLVK